MNENQSQFKITAYIISIPCDVASGFPSWWNKARPWADWRFGRPSIWPMDSILKFGEENWAYNYTHNPANLGTYALWITIAFKKESDRMQFLLVWAREFMDLAETTIGLAGPLEDHL